MSALAVLVAGTVPSAAATVPGQSRSPAEIPQCWTSFTDLTPGPNATFGVTYRNCTDSGVWVTPYYTNDASWWVYKACKYLDPWAWDSWTVRSPSFGVNFGVATCSDQSTHGYTVFGVADPPCGTFFDPRNPGPGGYVEHRYYNCWSPADVVAAYREADGDLGVYLHDGPRRVYKTDLIIWHYYAPQQPANLLTAFAIDLP